MHAEASIEIARPRSAVFELLADESRRAEWVDALVASTPEVETERGVGSRYRHVYREAGKERTLSCEVLERAAPERYAVRLEHPDIVVEITNRLEEVAAGTRLAQRFEVEPRSLVLKLVAGSLAEMARSRAQRDLERLRALCEEG